MKILAIHADYVEFQAKKKAFKGAEDLKSKDSVRVEECLVVFTAVEKEDEQNEKVILDKYLVEVKSIAKQVGADRVVLYPYAHLSSSLSAPLFGQKLMQKAEKELASDSSNSLEVSRAPFGWYKAFTVANKGHPLSELSRSINCEEEVSGEKKKTNLKKEFSDEKFFFEEDELDPLQKVNLSSVMLLAAGLKKLYSNVEIADCGFYQDQCYLDFSGVKLQQNNFSKISKLMRKILRTGGKISKGETSELSSSWQKDIANDLGKKAVVYSFGSEEVSACLVPRYSSPFVSEVSEIGAFELVGLGSVYWKGNQENEQLMRIRLVGFESEKELEVWKQKLEDAKNRSHIKIGKEQGLFVQSELVGSGLPLIAPKGMVIRTEITNFLWELHKGKGYKRVWTPHIAKNELYKTSGHWDKFGDELFKVKGKSEDFIMKPMNCPHHMQIFDGFDFSYRDMPIRYFEPATIYRDEKKGQLHGLSRVRSITQDDGHLFCRVSQIKEEVKTVVKIIQKFYETIGMSKDYWVSLSVRGEDKSKYLGEEKVWKLAENYLEEVARENKLPFKRMPGEAAFYGPKLDFMFKDALGREWQLGTVQCDFNLPERFDLSYVNEKGEKERPVVIHRAVSGSLERFMSVLIEHFAGKYPLWINPIQVKVLTVADRHNEFADKVVGRLSELDFRVEKDYRQETIPKKIREAQLSQASYILTIGDKEVESGKLAVRDRNTGKTEFGIEVDAFVSKLVLERDQKKL
ncbi:threonine--tRNA ligase [archaeon]|jgi:threonyl-tRNA synthetase|nr:threonine--tRNA ligase [archaeon]MBT6697452.1 threonine--tRNA ligase [archaeon]